MTLCVYKQQNHSFLANSENSYFGFCFRAEKVHKRFKINDDEFNSELCHKLCYNVRSN